MTDSERTIFIPEWARNMTPEQIAALDSDDFQIGPPPEPERKTVTVRIAVAINRDGTYRAFGSSDAKDGAMKFAVRPFRKRTGQTIIIEHEVPLPIPEPVEVKGEVG